MNHLDEEANFLDNIVRLKNNTHYTSLYRKPTRSQPYLHPISPHPPHNFASRVHNQALYHKRICSDAKEINLQLTTLKNVFIALGYKLKIVKNQITKVMSAPQKAS